MSQHLRTFDQLPNGAYVRLSQLVQLPNRVCASVPLPFSAPTLWRMVREGAFPRPIKFANRVTAWNVGEVRAWLDQEKRRQATPWAQDAIKGGGHGA